jgi:hypothetical protein
LVWVVWTAWEKWRQAAALQMAGQRPALPKRLVY